MMISSACWGYYEFISFCKCFCNINTERILRRVKVCSLQYMTAGKAGEEVQVSGGGGRRRPPGWDGCEGARPSRESGGSECRAKDLPEDLPEDLPGDLLVQGACLSSQRGPFEGLVQRHYGGPGEDWARTTYSK